MYCASLQTKILEILFDKRLDQVVVLKRGWIRSTFWDLNEKPIAWLRGEKTRPSI